MLSTDRKDFEDQVAILCAGFPPTMATQERMEAYWRGLQQMQLSSVIRVVDYALGESGPDKIPTPRQCWSIYRQLRTAGPSRSSATVSKRIDQYDSYANVRLFDFLHTKGSASEESLVELLIVKRLIVDQVRKIAAEDPRNERKPHRVFDALRDDLRDMLLAAFEKRWQAQPEEAIAAAYISFSRCGRLPGFSEEAKARLQQSLV